ncbi:hypothetical protein D9M70_637560 [compost metagenome]
MGIDRLDAVVAAMAAADLEPRLGGRQVEFVIDDGDVLWLQLVEAHGLADRFA